MTCECCGDSAPVLDICIPCFHALVIRTQTNWLYCSLHKKRVTPDTKKKGHR